MSFRNLLRAAAALLALAGAPATAQNCAGFPDMPLATYSAFCPNVEWIKNRGITAGCASGGYCPNDNVTRLSMAAFLTRMGDKLTPAVLEPVPVADTWPVQLDLGSALNPTPQVVCPTGDFTIPAGSYPRRAKFFGRVNLYNPSANGDFISEIVYTVTDIGQPASTTWLAVQNTAAYQTLYFNFSPAHDVSTYPQGYLDLSVGKIYRFGMRVSRFTPNIVANVAAYCVNLIEIGNRTSATTPFDAMYSPPADQPPAEGRALPRP